MVDVQVGPSHTHHPRGSPKKKKIRDPNEEKQNQEVASWIACSRRGSIGHNRRNHVKAINPSSDNSQSDNPINFSCIFTASS